MEGGYNFKLPSGAIISWGGRQSMCTSDEQNTPYDYGNSVATCIKGVRAQIGVENVRNKITEDDMKNFEEFVLKNK